MGIPFTNKEFQLKKGDRIYLFTDGFADQFGGPKGKKFKYKQLQGLLAVIAEEPMTQQFKILSNTFDTWKGSLEQVDDVCVIGLKV
ncbi:MAG: SpoIIE family protein phosphatase [Sphingobacteriaceae bacterium]|nr:SpoIIE family protein phosphatase [Sphingobacteriaceae bacterium]